ncbi:MAG: cation transporter [Flavobacteriales bacterium]|nr:cation transporter [Flavobacteriales bacterium]
MGHNHSQGNQDCFFDDEHKDVHDNKTTHHHHHHDHGDLWGWRLGVSIFLNVIITVSQVIGGIMSGSVALMTDALHNFSDVISLVISFIANKLTLKGPTISKTYGYKRAEILAAFINSATLIGIAIFLIFEAITRFTNPLSIKADIVIWFALASIVINFLSVVILHKNSKENMNVRSAYLHLLTDVMTSVAVMVGGVMMKYYGAFWVDSTLSLLIAFYLIYSSYHLLVESAKVLMQFTPDAIDIEVVSNKISDIDGVENLHHLHVWQLDDKRYMLEAHLELSTNMKISDFQEILHTIEVILKEFGIFHFNIQPELNRCKNKEDLIARG